MYYRVGVLLPKYALTAPPGVCLFVKFPSRSLASRTESVPCKWKIPPVRLLAELSNPWLSQYNVTVPAAAAQTLASVRSESGGAHSRIDFYFGGSSCISGSYLLPSVYS
jgi:hypothetical protein